MRRSSAVAVTAGARLPEAAGGKARGLQAIVRAGLSVPPAWSVLPDASPEDVDALARELEARGIQHVAVRSSAHDEDGGGASFAGIHDTALGVPLDQLREIIAEISRSPLAPRARAYRERLGLAPPSGPCAVIVQEMVDAICAGVAFGVGPNAVVIEAVAGLGELAVNGEAAPETWVMRHAKSSWRVLEYRACRQTQAVRRVASGIAKVALEGASDGSELLGPEVVATLADGVRTLETKLAQRLDVEWAWSERGVFFLQARPQTRPLESELPPGETWTRANSREVLPECPSALTRSTITRVVDGAQRELLRRQGIEVDPEIPLATYVFGRPVMNERVFAPSEALGFPPAWTRITMGGSGATEVQLAPLQLGKALRHWRVLWGLAGLMRGAARRARRQMEHRARARRELEAKAAQGLGDAELLQRIVHTQLEETPGSIGCVIQVFTSLSSALHQALSQLRGVPSPSSVLAELVAAEDVSVSTRQLEDLLDLARAFRDWPGGLAFLDGVGRESDRLADWKAALPAELWQQVRRWLDAYGHRCPHETDLAMVRPAEDPRLLRDALAPLVTAPLAPAHAEQRSQRRREIAQRAWARLGSQVSALRLWLLRRSVREIAALTALREELRSALMRDALCVRADVRELGRRLNARGQLEAKDHVFYLSLDELKRAVENPTFDAPSAVKRELARQAAFRRVDVPNRFTSEAVKDFARSLAEVDGETQALRGLAVSPGDVEGRVCVIRSPDEEGKLTQGGILVAHATDPAWTPLFARASGIVVELGGLLSHAATVAREFGIPCVANVEGAMQRLRDGDVVRVDGSRGEVDVVARREYP